MKYLLQTGSVLVVLCLLAISCATVSNISVRNVNDADATASGSFMYSLPLTVFDVYVQAEQISVVPGPYARYASKYLSIKDVPMKSETQFKIKSISLSKHLESDPEFIYSVNGLSDPLSNTAIAALIKDSLILKAADFSARLKRDLSIPYSTGELQYTDLSVKRNFEAEKDVDISMVMPDSGARPSQRMIMKEKTTEQKAEEAANFLIKLKKRRFKLIAGQYEYMPSGEAMASALDELARLEKEYLALFIGKRINQPVTRSFHYTPENGKTSDQLVLFRFSPTEGFVESRGTAGIPVMLLLEAAHKIKDLENRKIPAKAEINTVPYRIPDQASVKLQAGEQIWTEALYPVFQYGVPVVMDVAK